MADPSPAPSAPTAPAAQPRSAPKPAKAPKQVAPPKITQPAPVKIAKALPVEEPSAKPVEKQAQPQPAVSLKPIKKKKVKEVAQPAKPVKETPVKKDNTDLLQRQKLAQMLREEAILEEKARLAKEALEKERQLLQNVPKDKPVAAKATSTDNSQGSGSGGGDTSLIASRYYAMLLNHLLQYWALPEYMQMDMRLSTTVVITVRNDGSLANILFEKGSGDPIYDQFVRKTLQLAEPLPAIPAAMRKERLELGLVFKPGGIQ